MKYILLLTIATILFWACSDDSTGSDNGSNSFTTADVYSINTYLSFSTEKADTIEPTSWDVVFTSIVEDVYRSGCTASQTPVSIISLGNGITIAKVEAADIDEVSVIPDESLFKNDINEIVPVIGKNWFTMNLEFQGDVYAVKTCAGNFGLIQPYEATYNFATHQFEDIKWISKFNVNGSNDFSNALVDSFVADDSYAQKRYFSFLDNGAVTVDDAYEIILDGSNILLGTGSLAKNLGVTDINSVTIVVDENWEMDESVRWYDYNLNGMHRLTPKNEVYVLHTVDDKYAAMEIVGYDEGVFTVFWKYLDV